MTEKRYRRTGAWFRAHPAAMKLLKLANRLLPAAVYCSYFVILAVLALNGDARLFRAAAVPAAVFAGGTVLRAALNFPRPYEVYGIPPLTPKDKKGNSFPSRHLFSAAVIAVCACWVWAPAGIALGIVTLLLAPARVLAGVHFVRDVLAGIALGALCGWLGFYVI